MKPLHLFKGRVSDGQQWTQDASTYSNEAKTKLGDDSEHSGTTLHTPSLHSYLSHTLVVVEVGLEIWIRSVSYVTTF